MRLPFLFLSITSIFFRFLSKKFVYMLFIFIFVASTYNKDKSRNYKRYEKKETFISLSM